MATSCSTGQLHGLPDAPEAYGAMITRPKAAPPTGSLNLSKRQEQIEHVYDLTARPLLVSAQANAVVSRIAEKT